MSTSDPRVVVTGGAGFIGSHLVDALAAEGHSVLVFDNLFRGQRDFIARHVENDRIRFVKGDVRDRELLRSTLRGARIIYHLAAQSNVLGATADLEYSFSSNVTGTLNVLRAAVEAGARRVVFSSSREVYGEPCQLPVDEEAPLNAKSSYGASKIAGEAYCRVFGRKVETIVLRLTNVYGARDTDRVIPIFIKNTLEGIPLTLYGGQQVIDFVWVGYVIRVLLAAGFGNWPWDGPVNVGSGVGIPIRGLAEKVLQITGATAPIVTAPAREQEVVRFVASVKRIRSTIDVPYDDDSLAHLPLVVEYWKQRLTDTIDLR